MTDLVERLRKRAESEREIQRNNEAVADALEAQLDAFKRRDGTHNNFAVRLGLNHRSCAKNDAALAKDWDEAADALEAAQAQAAEVRRETVEECAQHLTTLADAMHEKAEAIADRSSHHGPFVRPLTSERDAAVMAYDFEQAATAIRALTDAAKEPDHVPDAGNMIAKVAGDHIPDAGEMVGKDNANG